MMLEEGYYPGRAVEWEFGYTANGTEQVAILFDVFADDGQKLSQRTYYGTFSEKGLPFTLKALRAAGWEGDDLSNLTGLDRNEVTLVIQHDSYNGKTRDKIAFVNRRGGLTIKTPMQDAQKRSFAARMRDQIRALDAAEGVLPKSPPTLKQEQSSKYDDDIPF